MLRVVGSYDQVDAHVVRLLTPSQDRKALAFFSTDKRAGFVMQNDRGHVDVTFPIEWRDDPDTEAAVRAFFAALGVPAWRDYLAGNGDVPDATRILAYPLGGDAVGVGAVAKRILRELCGISPNDQLIIQYTDALP